MVTVLRYIGNENRRWKIFIANRLTEIREHSEPKQWMYVPSSKNPADDATRGLPAATLSQSNRWLLAPSFLWETEDSWPSQPNVSPPDDSDGDLRRTSLCMNTLVADDNISYCLKDIVQPERFSSWHKLTRLVAWVLRAANNFCADIPRKDITPVKNPCLLGSEVYHAEVCLARLAQQEGFPRDFAQLQQHEDMDEKSQLLSLRPFYDASSHILRVGGRLQKAEIDHEVKHQILLPYDHHVTKLIVRSIHHQQAHCGPEHLIASVRQRFWPVKCRQLAKKVIFECFDCRRSKVKPAVPVMSDLPTQRVTGNIRPFQCTGLDFFGPIVVKRARSRIKRWGCIFTCLVTRSVHLEVADSLQTDDLILVLRCFVSRRGHPTDIFSDNATNFKGAERELKESLDQLDQQKISNFCLQGLTNWHFIPPQAPHYGGVWERLVKSVKTALKATLKEQVVTDTVLRTTLAEVEAVLNSRPITYNSSDVNDYTALTPNHFLHGGATPIVPVGDIRQCELDSRRRWRQCQALSDHIWQRWKKEYLPALTVRNKWKKDQRNLQVDDLVILVDDGLPRGQWSLGRVVELHPSEDGRVRAVKVKTSQGTYVRPASKICVMEEC